MSKLVANPITGQVFDYEHENSNHPDGKPGKWCPVTKMPLDRVALEHYDLSAFAHSDAKRVALAQATAYVEAVEAQLA